jgi:hypothetical protein
MAIKKIPYEYYKIMPAKTQWWGRRYFRYLPEAESVLSVVHDSGDLKKGRASLVGVYRIARLGFLANYKAVNKIQSISKQEFDQAFKTAVTLVRHIN